MNREIRKVVSFMNFNDHANKLSDPFNTELDMVY